MAEVTREQIKDQIDAAVAQSDIKMAELVGRLNERFGQMDTRFAELIGRSDRQFEEIRGEIKVVQAATSGLKSVIVITGVTIFIGIAAFMVGTLAYGSGAFYNGTVIRDMLNKK